MHRHACLLWTLVALSNVAVAHRDTSRPPLVVFVSVDMLRGDMPWRFAERFEDSGFRYLLERGVGYTSAHYRHATTFTAAGHATLATGGNPPQHGIVANDWHDRTTGRDLYCVEDDRHRVLEEQPKPHQGTSPRNLTATTFGDELVLSTERRSRVFSVSIKDRSAILLGGQLGKAYWFSTTTGRFVTSSYYIDTYPEWVRAWNQRRLADAFDGVSWALLQERERYASGDADDREVERSYKQLGRTFPHTIQAQAKKDLYATLRFTPMGDELTLAFARELVEREQLGKGAMTDVLCLSLSATDYIGHAFGPNSLEAEDNLLRLDRALASFFGFLDERYGLANVLLVLSSDHGVCPVTEQLERLGVAAGRHRPEHFVRTVSQALKQRFSTDRELIAQFWNPSLYLNLHALQEIGVPVETAEVALRDALLELPGFAHAITRTDLLAGHVTDEPTLRMVQRAFHPVRSGNVIVVQSPFWYLYPEADAYSAMHGSPYAYDTHVPIFLAGPGITPRTVHRRVGPEDIACTLADLLHVPVPSGSIGEPLVEVFARE
ncbi:MAG: alkaline phosphatase family protein [Planctomycetes bacterium]|nr:alkaline phosphatase family protein [Planctomycetota bacterium]